VSYLMIASTTRTHAQTADANATFDAGGERRAPRSLPVGARLQACMRDI
jgi:hypothetical protein